MRRDDALGLVGDPGCCCPRWRETSLALMILSLDFRAILCDSLMRRNSACRSRGQSAVPQMLNCETNSGAPTHPNAITTGSADRKAGHVLGFYEGSSRDPRWTIREGVTAGSISTLVVPTGGARNDKEVWAIPADKATRLLGGRGDSRICPKGTSAPRLVIPPQTGRMNYPNAFT